jgi:uncharacterized protein (TIGR02246 family)
MKQLVAPISTILMFALASVAVAEDLQSELTALEKSLWTASSKKDPAPFRKLVTDDSVQVTSSGVVTGKEAIIKDQMSCEVRGFALHDVRMHQLTPDVVALHYTATQDGTCNGEKAPPKVASTAIWQKKDGKWVNPVYHSTPIK